MKTFFNSNNDFIELFLSCLEIWNQYIQLGKAHIRILFSRFRREKKITYADCISNAEPLLHLNNLLLGSRGLGVGGVLQGTTSGVFTGELWMWREGSERSRFKNNITKLK